MLEMPTGKAQVVPVEPDRSRLVPLRGIVQVSVAQCLSAEWEEHPTEDVAKGTAASSLMDSVLHTPADLPGAPHLPSGAWSSVTIR